MSKNRERSIQGITVTVEAKRALDSLPPHVKRGRLLQDFKIVDSQTTTVVFNISATERPSNPQHTRSIRIINLVNAYNDKMAELDKLDIRNL